MASSVTDWDGSDLGSLAKDFRDLGDRFVAIELDVAVHCVQGPVEDIARNQLRGGVSKF